MAFASRLQTTGKNGGTVMITGIRVPADNPVERLLILRVQETR
jgi:hypothetical protein